MYPYLHRVLRAITLLATVMTLPLASATAQAGELIKVLTRPDIRSSVFWHTTEGATATLFVFPGGGGGFGKVEDGWPTSGNFLVRTAKLWVKEGFNLAIFGRPSDSDELGYEDRISDTHMQDVKETIEWVKTKNPAPIWVVGTSRGTISAAATLIKLPGSRIAGGVVTSSVVAYKKVGALPKQALDEIKVPVLVYHHRDDACELCKPHEVPSIISDLKNAPVKKLMMVAGGANPAGGVCEGQHWHGFIGMEQQAVSDIAAWIRQPTN